MVVAPIPSDGNMLDAGVPASSGSQPVPSSVNRNRTLTRFDSEHAVELYFHGNASLSSGDNL